MTQEQPTTTEKIAQTAAAGLELGALVAGLAVLGAVFIILIGKSYEP